MRSRNGYNCISDLQKIRVRVMDFNAIFNNRFDLIWPVGLTCETLTNGNGNIYSLQPSIGHM